MGYGFQGQAQYYSKFYTAYRNRLANWLGGSNPWPVGHMFFSASPVSRSGMNFKLTMNQDSTSRWQVIRNGSTCPAFDDPGYVRGNDIKAGEEFTGTVGNLQASSDYLFCFYAGDKNGKFPNTINSLWTFEFYTGSDSSSTPPPFNFINSFVLPAAPVPMGTPVPSDPPDPTLEPIFRTTVNQDALFYWQLIKNGENCPAPSTPDASNGYLPGPTNMEADKEYQVLLRRLNDQGELVPLEGDTEYLFCFYAENIVSAPTPKVVRGPWKISHLHTVPGDGPGPLPALNPVLSKIALSNITDNGADFSVTSADAANASWIVIPQATACPAPADIASEAGNNTGAMTPGTPFRRTLIHYPSGTAYRICFVAESGGLYSEVAEAAFTTTGTAQPPAPPETPILSPVTVSNITDSTALLSVTSTNTDASLYWQILTGAGSSCPSAASLVSTATAAGDTGRIYSNIAATIIDPASRSMKS